MTSQKALHWKKDLEAWSIPKEIIDQAEESPWIHPPVLFQLPKKIVDTFSHQKASEALPSQGSVLDIGCGGGIAAFALSDKAKHVIGVDHQAEMLTMFSENAANRGLTSEVYEGFWPAVSANVPIADVVTCHNVVYNVQEIVPFLKALNEHARKRVVIEMPIHHPLANMDKLWKHFWSLERPKDPTPADLIEVLKEIGINAQVQYWPGTVRQESNIDQAAEFMRIRLCLPKSREVEVKEFLTNQPRAEERDLATIWWDK
jgi:SAM-dependent methyltransferase